MASDIQDSITILPANSQQYAAALYVLLGMKNQANHAKRIAEMLQANKKGQLDFSGLFIAKRGLQIVGVCWANLHQGNTGSLWPAKLVENEARLTAFQLDQAALSFLAKHTLTFVQSLIDQDDTLAKSQLIDCKFDQLTQLNYLVALKERFLTTPPSGRLSFESFVAQGESLLQQVVQATYQQTLDCPELDGLRKMQDVLSGYRNSGHYDPSFWYVAKFKDQIIGCLLLNDYPDSLQTEIVYCGILPEYRGQAFGKEMVRFAQSVVRQKKYEQLVLAVDIRNQPAINMYEDCGFIQFDSKLVFLKSMDLSD